MKIAGWTIGVVALLLLAVGVYVVMNSGSLAERAIERYGARYLGASVAVDEVAVSLRDGSAGVFGLVVGNPPGFSGAPAFALREINVTLDSQQTSSERIVLNDVVVDGADLTALVTGRRMNLKQLMDNLEENIDSGEQAAETGVESELELIIDRFRFTNARASVESDLLGSFVLDIPDIEVTDIGRASNGASIGQAMEQMLKPIYRAVSRGMVARGVDLEGGRERLEENVRDKIDEQLDGGLKSLQERLRGDGA